METLTRKQMVLAFADLKKMAQHRGQKLTATLMHSVEMKIETEEIEIPFTNTFRDLMKFPRRLNMVSMMINAKNDKVWYEVFEILCAGMIGVGWKIHEIQPGPDFEKFFNEVDIERWRYYVKEMKRMEPVAI